MTIWGRNRGNFAAYREVVAAALGEQVDKARARGVMDVLSKAEVERAFTYVRRSPPSIRWMPRPCNACWTASSIRS